MKYVLRVYPLAVISSNIASSPVVGENAVSVNQTGALVRFNAPRRYIPLHLKYYTNTQHSLTYKAVQVWLKSGYTYNVRIGAKVNDTFGKYNYSEIKEVIVP